MPYAGDELVSHANKVLATGSNTAKHVLLTTNAVLPPSGGIRLAEIGHAGGDFSAIVNNSYSKLKVDGAANAVKFIRVRANEKTKLAH